MAHVEGLCYSHQCFETQFLISEDQEQEACHEVHSLAIFDFWVEEGVRLKYIIEYFGFDNVPETVEGSLHIHRDEFGDTLLQRLSLVHLSVVFESAIRVALAVDFVSERIIIFLVLIYLK